MGSIKDTLLNAFSPESIFSKALDRTDGKCKMACHMCPLLEVGSTPNSRQCGIDNQIRYMGAICQFDEETFNNFASNKYSPKPVTTNKKVEGIVWHKLPEEPIWEMSEDSFLLFAYKGVSRFDGKPYKHVEQHYLGDVLKGVDDDGNAILNDDNIYAWAEEEYAELDNLAPDFWS